MLKIKSSQRYLLLIMYLLLSIIMTTVINTKGVIWGGDDVVYHIGRLITMHSSYENGVIIPNISTSNFALIGYGVNLFYPWITLVPMTLLSLVIHNPITAYYWGLGFFMFVSFYISHYSMKRFSGSEKQAIIFSLIYGFANYRLLDVFSRGDLSEYIATVFLPLAFLGFYETFFRDYQKWPLLAAGMSLLLLSHILTTVITAFFFIIILIFCWFRSNNFGIRIKKTLMAIVTSFLASAIFLVPFLSEVLYQRYAQPSPYILKGKDSLEVLTASLMNNASRSIDGNVNNIGLVLLIAVILGVFFFKSFDRTYRTIYLLGVLGFVMVMKIFPWFIFQHTPISVIQFPSRMSIVSTLFLSVIATKIFSMVFMSDKSWLKSAGIIGFLAVVLVGMWTTSVNGALQRKFLTAPSQIVTEKTMLDHATNEGHYDEYAPAISKTHIKDIVEHVGFVDQKKTTLNLVPDGRYLQLNLLDVKKGTIVDVPMIKYRHSTVKINGQAVKALRSDRGTIQFKAPKNYSKAKIELGYHNGTLVWVSLIVSLLTWLWLILELVYKD